MSRTDEEFYSRFTFSHSRESRRLKAGDRVVIVAEIGRGVSGTIVETGVPLPWTTQGIKVDRDDGTGVGLYSPSDVRLTGHSR